MSLLPATSSRDDEMHAFACIAMRVNDEVLLPGVIPSLHMNSVICEKKIQKLSKEISGFGDFRDFLVISVRVILPHCSYCTVLYCRESIISDEQIRKIYI